MPYLSASAVVIRYEEALYQVYAPYLTLPIHRDKVIAISAAQILQLLYVVGADDMHRSPYR